MSATFSLLVLLGFSMGDICLSKPSHGSLWRIPPH